MEDCSLDSGSPKATSDPDTPVSSQDHSVEYLSLKRRQECPCQDICIMYTMTFWHRLCSDISVQVGDPHSMCLLSPALHWALLTAKATSLPSLTEPWQTFPWWYLLESSAFNSRRWNFHFSNILKYCDFFFKFSVKMSESLSQKYVLMCSI